MKKLFLLVAVCLAATFSSNAQVQNVTVTNYNNTCNVYFTLEGNVFSSVCTGGTTSSLITFVPGQTQTFDATIIGLAVGDNLVAANIPDADASLSCIVTFTGVVSDPCFAALPSVSYTVYDSNCIPCSSITAIWTPTGPTTANLDFY